MLSEELRRKLESLPTQPGCYIMKDRAGAVVYVGKAVNLRARVAQYFQERTGDSRIFIPFLEELRGDIEVMITPSEKDAILLENELIKKYRPRFNIRLRDDKNFISLRLSRTHPYPRLPEFRPVGSGEAFVGEDLPGFNVDLTIYLFVHQPLCALAMTADEHIWNRCVGIAAE